MGVWQVSDETRAMGLRSEAKRLRDAMATLESQAKRLESEARDLERRASQTGQMQNGCACGCERC